MNHRHVKFLSVRMREDKRHECVILAFLFDDIVPIAPVWNVPRADERREKKGNVTKCFIDSSLAACQEHGEGWEIAICEL